MVTTWWTLSRCVELSGLERKHCMLRIQGQWGTAPVHIITSPCQFLSFKNERVAPNRADHSRLLTKVPLTWHCRTLSFVRFFAFFRGVVTPSLMPAGPDASHMLDPSSMGIVTVIATRSTWYQEATFFALGGTLVRFGLRQPPGSSFVVTASFCFFHHVNIWKDQVKPPHPSFH